MKIEDQCGVITKVLEQNDSTQFMERGAFAYGERSEKSLITLKEYSMFEDFGIGSSNDRIFIPKMISHSFLQLCNDNMMIPVFVHCHEHRMNADYKLDFSCIDYDYMKSIAAYTKQFQHIKECLFIVTDGVYNKLSRWEKDTEAELASQSLIERV